MKTNMINIYISVIRGYNNGDKGHKVFDGPVRSDWVVLG